MDLTDIEAQEMRDAIDSGSVCNTDPVWTEKRKELARRDGYEVVEGSATTLLLDLDTPEAEAQYRKYFGIVHREFGALLVGQWNSKSGRLHVLLELPQPLEVSQRLALQAALGSDPAREIMSVALVNNGCAEPSCLFKPSKKEATNGADTE